jgi:hypothetical protein
VSGGTIENATSRGADGALQRAVVFTQVRGRGILRCSFSHLTQSLQEVVHLDDAPLPPPDASLSSVGMRYDLAERILKVERRATSGGSRDHRDHHPLLPRRRS